MVHHLTPFKPRPRCQVLAANMRQLGSDVMINLSPADLPKEGSHFDLPIALIRLLFRLGASWQERHKEGRGS